jgi:hypothetical protein
VFLSAELAASMLMGLLDIVLTALAMYAYARCRQSLFLLLAAGTLAFVLTNFYAAMLTYSALTRTTIFSPAVAHSSRSVTLSLVQLPASCSSQGQFF